MPEYVIKISFAFDQYMLTIEDMLFVTVVVQLLNSLLLCAETQGWKIDIMEATPNPMGGYKEVIFMINGQGAYSKFKFENGAHRVQRVPATESQGRIHTSTATVVYKSGRSQA